MSAFIAQSDRHGRNALQFAPAFAKTLELDGSETVDVLPVEGGLTPRCEVTVRITRADGTMNEVVALCRLDTENEIAYFHAGGILSYVLNDLVENAA